MVIVIVGCKSYTCIFKLYWGVSSPDSITVKKDEETRFLRLVPPLDEGRSVPTLLLKTPVIEFVSYLGVAVI